MLDAQWQEETRHLKMVHGKISMEIEKRERSLEGFHRDLMATRKSIWDDIAHNWQRLDLDAAVEIKQYLDGLKQNTQLHSNEALQVAKLKRLEGCPYFGRFDFKEDGFDDIEKIYIGILSFFDERGDILIYDWRAPISGIFYDYELGRAGYNCPDGRIEGLVSLKRQYRITGSTLHYMFDTGLKIDDELLQEIVSRNTDEKMRNIVNSIQKEQNRVIRDETHGLLMVQGAAGSGKTSIALHRIAYLLYKYRDQNITSKNILIFSPNAVFNDYISHVLPELGEENMQQTTFFEYLERMVGKGYTLEDPSSHMEYMLSLSPGDRDNARMKGIRFKSSKAFLGLLDAWAAHIEAAADFSDLCFKGNVLVPGGVIRRLYNEDYSYLPHARRLRKIRERLLYLIRPAWRSRLQELTEELSRNEEYKTKAKALARLTVFREFKPLRESIAVMTAFDTFKAYMGLFRQTDAALPFAAGTDVPSGFDDICNDTVSRLKNHILGYEDLSGYAYFKGLMEGVPDLGHIRHVVVDEAQDYTPVQYGILKQLFPNTRITLLGDFNQAIHPNKDEFSYDDVRGIMKPATSAILTLTKSYRSTREIVEFTRTIPGGSQEIEAIQRSGPKPGLKCTGSEEGLVDALVKDLARMQEEGLESIGIILKTAAESRSLHERLKGRVSARLLDKDDNVFIKGITILPVYLAKGLEFDGAAVYGADDENYGCESDRKLFYTACTRALHRLNLYYTGRPSPFAAALEK